MIRIGKVVKCTAPFVAAALCGLLAATADAAPKPKQKRNAEAVRAVVAEPPPAQQCRPGAGTNADGTCITRSQWSVLWSGININNAAVQVRMNYNWAANSPASGSAESPVAKDFTVFDQGIRGVNSHGVASDIRLKRDIVPVARLDNGIELYRFRYLWSDRTYVGVMAQEVAAIRPDAVTVWPNGYLAVYYDRLGLKMQTWEEWQAAHHDPDRLRP